jgi:hypothetical protein
MMMEAIYSFLQNVNLQDGSEDAACSYKMHVNIYQNT